MSTIPAILRSIQPLPLEIDSMQIEFFLTDGSRHACDHFTINEIEDGTVIHAISISRREIMYLPVETIHHINATVPDKKDFGLVSDNFNKK